MSIIFSKPITARTNFIPDDFILACSEADVSLKYENSYFKFFTFIKPQIVVSYFVIKNIKSKKDIVITGRYGFLFALLNSLNPFFKIKHILTDMEFKIYPNNSCKSRFYNYIKKFILKNCYKISVFCEIEADRYSKYFNIEHSKFFFLPYCSEVIDVNFVNQEKNDYIFSGGLHNRDYKTLFLAINDIDCRFVIAAPKFHFEGLCIPRNVEIVGVVPKKKYVELIKFSRFVVLALSSETLRFPGVITYCYAMSLGKCVIVNDVFGAKSYIDNGKNGFLCKNKDPKSLKNVINYLLLNNDKVFQVEKCATIKVKDNFNFKSYFSIIKDLCRDN